MGFSVFDPSPYSVLSIGYTCERQDGALEWGLKIQTRVTAVWVKEGGGSEGYGEESINRMVMQRQLGPKQAFKGLRMNINSEVAKAMSTFRAS